VEVIIEGQLSGKHSIREVLRDITRQAAVERGILRIACPGKNLNGRLALARGRYIVGACVSDSNESGYAAVKRLLMVQEGNFAFLDAGGEHPADVNQSLYVSIERLLDLLPNLPDSPVELFDEKSLLDEVFGGGGVTPPRPIEAVAEVKPALTPEASRPQPPASWSALSPLLGETPAAETKRAPILGAGGRPTQSIAEAGKITFDRLRALPINRLSRPRTLLWVAVAALLIALLIILGPKLISRYNAEKQDPPASQGAAKLYHRLP